jgi:hypothetical protein
LPEERDWYLAVFREKDTGFQLIPRVADYRGENTWDIIDNNILVKEYRDILECVAWMPLPEPYNAETKPQKSSEEKSCNNCKWRNSDGCLLATCSMIGRDGHGLWERAESEGK